MCLVFQARSSWAFLCQKGNLDPLKKKAQVISPTACPWWNPRGSLPQGCPVPPRSLSELSPKAFSCWGKNGVPLDDWRLKNKAGKTCCLGQALEQFSASMLQAGKSLKDVVGADLLNRENQAGIASHRRQSTSYDDNTAFDA